MALENADLEMDLYYVDPRSPLKVRKRPVVQFDQHGRETGSTMGFVVCECDPDVDGAAEEIARSLNRLPKAEAILVDVVAKVRHAFDHLDRVGNMDGFDAVQPLGDAIETWMCS